MIQQRLKNQYFTLFLLFQQWEQEREAVEMDDGRVSKGEGGKREGGEE